MRIIQTIPQEMKETFKETAKILKGHERRRFMARIVQSLGRGGASWAERELGWNRNTINKGRKELESGEVITDNYRARGRKKAEHHLPNLLEDIKAIIDGESQTDGTFRSTRLYTRMSAKEVRKQLIEEKGYTDEELPQAKTIGVKMNELGYRLRPVAKSKPQKK
jgi:hypothetical protein